jgi:hypothetical protein
MFAQALGTGHIRWKDIETENKYASGLGQGQVAGSCEHGDKPSGSIEGGEFLE